MSNCLYTCGLCICNPLMCQVGTGAATAGVGLPVCGSIGTACCGMPQVSIAGTKTSLWPWLLGGAAVLYLLSRRRRM